MISTKKQSKYKEQIRIRENINNAIDTNYQYTTEVENHLGRKSGSYEMNTERKNSANQNLMNSSYFMDISQYLALRTDNQTLENES